MANLVNVTITIDLPEGANTSSVSIKPSGKIVLTDAYGKEVIPKFVERTIHRDRPNRPDKGPKILGRHKQANMLATVGGLQELASYDSIFVIDTNTRTFEQDTVSVACFVRCRLVQKDEKFNVVCDEGRLNIYEFRHITGKPELVSILKVAKDVLSSEYLQTERNIAFVTDSELDSHDSINMRTTPLFGPHCLPKGFTLLHATSDAVPEVLNLIIRFCDRQADKYFKKLEEGTANGSKFQVLPEDSSVKYRFKYHDDLTLPNSLVSELSIADTTNISFYAS